MTGKPSDALRRAGGRAKSDVANKLVSMCLHLVSREVCEAGGLRVESPQYRDSVVAAFGEVCGYCERDLALTPVAVEHLDAMNRYRRGLHVPGNVFLSCKECNNAKRRSDGAAELKLAGSGWEDFLSHDGSKCEANCPACAYWSNRVGADQVGTRLATRREAIRLFRAHYASGFATTLPPDFKDLIERVYTEAQATAQTVAKTVHDRWTVLSAMKPV